MSLYSLEAFAAGQLLAAELRTLERDEVGQIEEDLQDIQQAWLQRTLNTDYINESIRYTFQTKGMIKIHR